ncbi:MAG: hypothetical protein ACRC9V_06360 [Aeromonas sp.]
MDSYEFSPEAILMDLGQDGRNYVEEFLELCYRVSWNDRSLNLAFLTGLDDDLLVLIRLPDADEYPLEDFVSLVLQAIGPEAFELVPSGRPEAFEPFPSGRPEAFEPFPSGRQEAYEPFPSGRPETFESFPSGRPEAFEPVLSGRPAVVYLSSPVSHQSTSPSPV